MSSLKVLLTVLMAVVIDQHECYRILGIFPLNGHSHMVMFEALMKGLAKKGHQVDVVNLFPQKTKFPNYTDIVIPPALPKLVNNMTFEFIEEVKKNDIVHFIAVNAGNLLCEKGLETLEIQNLMKKSKKYDLVIVELFGAHCFMAFGHLYQVPVIAISSSALYPWGNSFIENPENLAFLPNNLLGFNNNMNFWQRLFNVLHTFYYKQYFNYYTAIQDELIQKHFGPKTPGVRDLERNVALVLSNSHFSLNGVKPITPALIEVGGLHIQDNGAEIPREDMEWLNKSSDGFIFFTFGSMVTIESFPISVLDVLYKSLGKIAPVRVFMKVPRPELLPAGLPSNIRTFSWTTQLKVLKHKNIRAFITHGGLMGTQEAIYCAVPLIGIPLFADQYLNVDTYVKKKIAVRLDYTELTEKKFDNALNEILHNPVYSDTIRKISKQFVDRPLSPMDTAIYWIDYVIRNGNNALRSPALEFSWWQIALLDVYFFILFIFLLATVIIIKMLGFLISKVFSGSTKKMSAKKNN